MHHVITLLQDQPFWHHDGMMGVPWGWWIFWLVVLVVVIWLATTVARGEGAGSPDAGAGSAEEVLRARFARGEISEEEFQEKLRALRDSRSG